MASSPPRSVYLDYNATAPLRPEVRAFLRAEFEADADGRWAGNPSSVHWAGQEARRRLEGARSRVAALLDRRPQDIIFTSSGTEANNLAIRGVLAARRDGPRRLILSEVEHPAATATARALAESGMSVDWIPVTPTGALDLDRLRALLDRPAALVSVMAVNNETGIVHPIADIARETHAKGARLHVDAVQAAGRQPLPAAADLLTLSGHKLGAPPGVGVLVHAPEQPLAPILHGGPQERGRRAGTESLLGAECFAIALAAALRDESDHMARLQPWHRALEAVLETLPGVAVVGAEAPRVSNTTCFVSDGVDGEALLQALDLEGFAVSSGSACSSGSLEASHVLTAMGIAPERALSAVRVSTGWATAAEDLEAFAARLPRLLAQTRV